MTRFHVRGEGSSDLAAKVAAEINTAGGRAVSNNFSASDPSKPRLWSNRLLMSLVG